MTDPIYSKCTGMKMENIKLKEIEIIASNIDHIILQVQPCEQQVGPQITWKNQESPSKGAPSTDTTPISVQKNKIQNKLQQKEAGIYKLKDLGLNNILTSMNKVKNQIISKILQHNLNVRQFTSPSLEQISKCAVMLQQQFPRMKVDHIIYILQDLIVNNTKIQQKNQEQSFNSISQEPLENRLNRSDYSKANAMVREKAAIIVPPGACLSQQKKIAISYLNHGYGIRVLRQYIKDPQINSTRYNNIITTIMKLAFRKLQEHIKQMGRPVVPVNSQDEKVIRAPLTNCQKWLPPQQLETFYKFIKLACYLQQKLDINPASTIKLYDFCIRQLRQRQMNEHNAKNQKIIRGSHRLPRIAQSMYNLIGNSNQYNSNELKNSLQNYNRIYYTGQSTKMAVDSHLFHMNNMNNMNNTQRKRINADFQAFNIQSAKMKNSERKNLNVA